MNKHREAKSKIYQQICDLLDTRIVEFTQAITSIKESRDNETKSSAGDKYETGRAMMQIELDKNETQLNNTLHLKKELAQLDLQNAYSKVAFGSLVITNQENYFISVGLGKITVGHETYYAISQASPIGQVLKNREQGSKIEFLGREILIQNIL